MKRVLIVTSSYPTEPTRTYNAGGFVRDISRTLHNLGHPVCVVTPAKDVPITDPELKVITFPWLSPAAELATIRPTPGNFVRLLSLVTSGAVVVAATVRVWQPEFILAFWAVPSGLLAYVASRGTAVPYGVWALGSDIWARRRYPMGEAIVRRVLSRASFRLADGLALAGEVEKLSGRPCKFMPSSRTLPGDVAPAKLDDPGVNFLFVGRFEYQKGIDVLIDAIDLILSRKHVATFHIIGDGSLRGLVEKRIRDKHLFERVKLYGYGSIELVVSMMKACDYLIIPSRIESIPVVLSDAIGCGLPVIATNVGDMGAIIAGSGIGFVVGPPSPEALVTGIEAALNTPKEQFSENLRAAGRLFDPALVAARLSTLIQGNEDGPDRIPVGLLAHLGKGTGSGWEDCQGP
jgi:glycosyltransferase involved in cell wall biosynthesis